MNINISRPIAPPAIPAAPLAYAAIPPAPVPAGPAPADTVTVQKISAPVRSHVQITPQVTNIVPEVQVNKYNVDVPVAVPRAVPLDAKLGSTSQYEPIGVCMTQPAPSETKQSKATPSGA